jgi:hypothetical protein
MSLIGWIAVSLLALSVGSVLYLWHLTRGGETWRVDLVANFVTGAFVAFAVFGVEYLVDQEREKTARQENLVALVGREDDLSGIDLTGRDLSGLFLRGKNFRSANLSGANLENALLDGAQLQDARLVDARLEGASLRSARLPLANLSKAHLAGADLTGADLKFTDLRGADLDHAKLFGANLFGADLRGASLTNTVLIDASLRSANLMDVEPASAAMFGAEYDYLTRWTTGDCPPSKESCHLRGRSLLAAFDSSAKADPDLQGWERTSKRDQIAFGSPSADAQLTARGTRWPGSAQEFAAEVRRQVGGLPHYRELDALRRITIAGGGPAFRIVFDWRPIASQPVTVIHVYYVESRTAYEFTATARGVNFLQLQGTFERLFAALSDSTTSAEHT